MKYHVMGALTNQSSCFICQLIQVQSKQKWKTSVLLLFYYEAEDEIK